MAKQWYVYFVRCSDNSLYCGVTTDVNRRINEHNHSNQLGAKYTRVRRPVELAFQEAQPSKQAAYKREYALKQLTKKQKEYLIANIDS
ncbi:GIY-YIG nuclease family protein [Colwellia sp. MEBiC06753]